MNDLMLDIETMGTRHDSVITQIGMCYWDRETGKIGQKFRVNIAIDDCIKNGLTVDGRAIKFWLSQSGRSFLDNPQSLRQALMMTQKFVAENSLIWCHATFDAPIINNAFKTMKLKTPYKYRSVRDIRTLVDLAQIPWEKKEVDPKSHDALEDCVYQVEYCHEAMKKMGENK